MRDYLIEIKKWLLLWILFSITIYVLISIWKAFETELNIDNNSWFLQSLFFTSDGKVDSQKKIIFDWVKWDISLSWNLNILPWAIANKKLVSLDFVPWSVLNNDIWTWQVVNAHFVTWTITTNKIINNSLLSWSFANWSINNTKILNNTWYVFNKIISNSADYFIDPNWLSSLSVMSWNNLKTTNFDVLQLIVSDKSLFTTDKLYVKWDFVWNSVCDNDFCIWSKPPKIGSIWANKRCQYKSWKIECIESFWD